MAEGKGGKIISMTVKRARRVQEKMMQKLGKSDQTRDEVFEEFVSNFQKQHASAFKLQREITRYMNHIRVLYQSTKTLSETLKELYEEEWDGSEKQRELMEQRILLWEDLLTSLTSRIVEPMGNYTSQFSDIKNRIQKRERKVVDYDLRRRELEHAKSKAKINDQKIQQAEEAHTQAKQLYDEITDELYEELPTFYDSRIQFYAQIFQSIAAAESKFHTEVAKIDEELAIVMDKLASESATGVHSTKKQRSATSVPKLLSRPGEEESEDDSEDLEASPSNSPSLGLSHTSPTPHAEVTENNIESPSHESAATLPTQAPSEEGIPTTLSSVDNEPTVPSPVANMTEKQTKDSTVQDVGDSGEAKHEESSRSREVSSPLKSPPPKPAPLQQSPTEETSAISSPETSEEKSSVEKKLKEMTAPDNLLYTVIATHLYQGEDEDELSFEKGATIYVVPYDDPDDEEEGWAMGILSTTGEKGIFPENFTKRPE